MELAQKYKKEIEDTANWVVETYDREFSEYFKEVDRLYTKFNSGYEKITDEDLEEVMSTIPLKLFEVTERLAKYRAFAEFIKYKIKEKRNQAFKDSDQKTQALKKEDADSAVAEDEFFLKLHNIMIEMVESKMSYSRELIMSAKKIYTARKQTELNSKFIESKVTQQNDTLPEYEGFGTTEVNAYIK